MEDAVRNAIESTGYPQLRSVEAYYDAGRVTLQGAVSTYFLKQIVGEVVLRVDGVTDVDNDIRIQCAERGK
jgi:osmotically-inducible protein OsmY